MKRDFCIAVLPLVMVVLVPALGISGTVGLRASVGAGYDDNIFREAANRNGGWFLPYSVWIRDDFRLSRIDRIRPRIFASGRKYSSTNRTGDDTRLGTTVTYTRRLMGNKLKYVRVPSLDFHLSVEAMARQTTYYSRSRGEEVAVPGDNGPVPLSDRYDAKSLTGSSSLVLHWPRRTRWKVSAAAKRKDYDNDFHDVPTVDPLDYDNRRVEFTLEQAVGRHTHLDGSYAYSSTNYDAWTARDFDGNKVPGTSQKFRYKTWRGRIRYTMPHPADLGLELYSRRRTDPFQGYYDYKEWGVRANLGLKPLSRVELKLRYRFSHREYERARVGFNPLKALRDDYDRIFIADLDYLLRSGRTLFIHLVHDNMDEKNPLYTYDRTRSSLGFRLEF